LVGRMYRKFIHKGNLRIRLCGLEGDDVLLAGPAEIVAAGEFYYDKRDKT